MNLAIIIKVIVFFIVSFYSPLWFMINRRNNWIEAPFIFLEMLQRLRLQDDRIVYVLQGTLERNSFVCHPEFLLQAMISSQERGLRKTAVKLIEIARAGDANLASLDMLGDISPRQQRNNPQLNFMATSVKDMIDWIAEAQKGQLLEPPLTCGLTLAEVYTFVDKPMEVPKFPLHTQAVERFVRRVNSVSLKVQCFIIKPYNKALSLKLFVQVSDMEERDGMVHSQVLASSRVPRPNTKRDLRGLLKHPLAD